MSLRSPLVKHALYVALLTTLAASALSCSGSVPVETSTPAENPSPSAVTTVAGATAEAATPTPVVEATPTAMEASPTPAAMPSPSVTPAGTGADAARYADLRKSIEGVLGDLNGTWGIGVKDLSTGDTLLINADRAYPAASQYKLLVFYEAYRRITAGALQLDQMTTMLQSDYADSIMWDEELKPGDRVSIKGLLRVLVIQSSNAAAHATERVMGISSVSSLVNSTAQQLGLTQTSMSSSGDAQTSVTDLMRFYEALYRGELVSKDASKAMLDLLKEQQINDRIPAQLPSGVKVAHKTGNLPGVVNDAGIIFGPQNDIVLIVLNDGADYEQGTAAIGKIAQLVYSFHQR